MSGSLHKKKHPLKENQHRLSNTKLTSCFIPITKLNCSDLPIPDKTTRKVAKTKTTRKHQMSVESILYNNKLKEPYTLRSTHIDKSQKDKTKNKKRKKQKEEEQRFNIPVFEFSRSNSLIVFSEKESTINHNAPREKHFPRIVTPHQAATLIQKTWRGYLTRKLLDQYIYDEENRINSAINHLRSKEDSFFMDKHEQMNFSEYSSIPQDTLPLPKESQWSNGKLKCGVTTYHGSNSRDPKQSPVTRSFFKNHRTQTDLDESKQPQQFTSATSRKATLDICSSVINVTHQSKPKPISLPQTIETIKSHLHGELTNIKKALKDSLTSGEINLEDMASKSARARQIYDNSTQFLENVLQQLNAIIEDMQSVSQNESQTPPFIAPSFQPKSQMFTLDMEEPDNQPEPISEQKQHFSQGQLKLQSYLSDLYQDYNNSEEINELQYLCQVIKFNSEKGVKTITERCLLQFTVQIITSSYTINNLLKVVQQITFNDSEPELFVVKWINELNKWEMGTIQEVTQNMESSSFINGSLNRSSQYTE